ncbi:translation termination inhibitor protein itt1 [Epicoccum nigrum]|nr:translation termination inhibitor protein itt1 [Epicoccum nigrum]
MYAYISYLEELAEQAFGMHSLEHGKCSDKCYFNNAILTGDIHSVKYPAFRCRDKPSERARYITPRELLQVPIKRPAVQRYVNLKRKKKLESEASTIWCPLKWCQGAVKENKYPMPDVSLDEMGVVFESDADTPHHDSEAITDDAEDEATKDAKILSTRLQVCEDCSYAFCHLCKRTWHGDFVECRSDGIDREEAASLTFIQQNTARCPTYVTPVQKIQGCNHITCTQCQTHFCYLCSAFLHRHNPYEHFNLEGRNCYQRIWEGEEGSG